MLILLTIASVCDHKYGRIPNEIIIIGMVMGIIRLFLLEDMISMMFYLPGIVLPVLLFYPIYKIGGIGAGDIKLFSMIAVYVPITQLLFIIFSSLFLGALLSLFKMTYYQNFTTRLEYLFSYLKKCFSTGQFHLYHEQMDDEEMKRSKIRLAIPTLASTVLIGGIF